MTPVANCRQFNDTGGKFCHQFRLCCWHHRCQRYRQENLPPVSTTPVANCHRYHRHRRQILPPVPLVLLCQRHRQQICHRCQRHRWQIMGTISGCRHLKVNLKAKIYVNSTTQRCSNKIIKNFLFEVFFHLPPVSLTPVVHLEPRISLRIFEKIWNGLKCLRETDSWKKPEVENLVTLSL